MSTLQANADGGFDVVRRRAAPPPSGRVFAYRAGNGDLMLVLVDGDGTVLLFTQKRSNVLPTVGVKNTTWNVTLNRAAGGARAGRHLEQHDPVGRHRRRQLGPPAAFRERRRLRLFGDAGRQQPAGRLHLPPGGDDHGGRRHAVEIREFDTLVLRGMGFSAVVIPSNKSFVFSVNQP